MEKDNIKINLDVKCATCKYGVILNPFDSWCAKYKLKPKEVLYEGEDCPNYVHSPYGNVYVEAAKKINKK